MSVPVVHIGNLKGISLPKAIIKRYDINKKVNMEARTSSAQPHIWRLSAIFL
jgi:hypothetical protein